MIDKLSQKPSKSLVSSYKEEDALAMKEALLALAPESSLEIVEAVRRARHVAGMTQLEYADATGVSLPTLSAIERGLGSPTLATLNALLVPLGLQMGVVKMFEGKVSSKPWRRPNLQALDSDVKKRQSAPKLRFNQPRKVLRGTRSDRDS